MKKLLTLLVLFFSLFCRAQNYQCLQAGVKHYFINGNGYLRGIRIDSVKTYSDSVVYYPFHTPRGAYTTMDTLDSLGGSWLGSRVIQLNDGTFLFDNIRHDTVVIKSQAHAGDTWIFFRDTSTNVYYKAAITSVDTMTILGIPDSVKMITITSWDSTTNLTYDSLDNIQLILSKNHGFVRTIDVYMFPYNTPGTINSSSHGSDLYSDQSTLTGPYGYFPPSAFMYFHNKQNSVFELFGFQPPTFAELYQWNSGDVYEYAISNGFLCIAPIPGSTAPPDEYDVDSISGVNVVAGSVQYPFTGTKFSFDGSWPPASSPFVHYAAAANGGTMIYDSIPLTGPILMPEEFGQDASYFYSPVDGHYCITSPLYGVSVTGLRRAVYIPPFEWTYPELVYKSPLGLLYSKSLNIDGCIYEYSQKLIYYHRSDTNCGSIHIPLLVPISSPKTSDISTFPNPAASELTIKTNLDQSYTIALINVMGQTMQLIKSVAPEQTIDVSNYPAGVYNVSIIGEDGSRWNDKVVIMH